MSKKGLNCPVKDAAWRELLRAVNGNEKEAYRLWLSNNEEVPSIEQLRKEGILPELDKETKFQSVIDNYVDRRTYLYKKLAQLKTDAKSVKGDEKLVVDKEIQRVEHSINNINESIEELQKTAEFEDIYKFAQSDLNEVDAILNSKSVSMNDLQRVNRIIKLWKRIGSLDARNPFFNESELESFSDLENITAQSIVSNLKQIQVKAENLDVKWYKIAEGLLNAKVKATFGQDANIDMKEAIRDISKSSSLLLDLSYVDNIVTKAMFSWNKQATHESNGEIRETFEGIEKVMKKVNKRFSQKEQEEIYAQTQSNTDSRKTGDLVFRFSQEFFNWNRVRNNNFYSKLDKLDGEAKKKHIMANNAAYKQNTIMFDARKLFPIDDTFTKEDIDSHRKELISQLGQKGFIFYFDRMKDKIENYNASKFAEEELLKSEYGEDQARIIIELDKWDSQNSPYKAAESFYDNKVHKVAGEYISSRNTYTEVVPRKEVNGVSTGFYDSKFEKIEGDDDLYTLYSYLLETMHSVNSYLPQDIQKNIHTNTLPFIKKSVIENFTQGGLFGAASALNENWVEALRTGMGGTIEPTDIRDIEGERIRSVQFNGNIDVESIIKDYIDRKVIEYKIKNGDVPNNDSKLLSAKIEWRKEIQAQLSEERSFNLESILKLYSMAAISYKHKAKVEDAMNTAYNVLGTALEQQITNAGEDIRNQDGTPVTKKGLTNLKDKLDYFMSVYYGEPKALKEGAFGDKVYTKKEKGVKEELEGLKEANLEAFKQGVIDKKSYLSKERELDSQLAKLGGKKTVSNIGDIINSYIRIKGLGWNFFAPIMNMNVGFFTNMTEASGGTRFTQEQLTKAYGLTLSDRTGKVSNLMSKLDVLKEVQNEAYNSRSVAKGWKRRLAPFYLTSKAEYLNQAPVMIAMMMNTKVEVDGKETSLWEAYDKDGNLPEGIIFKKDITGEAGFKTRVDSAIKDIHGNYDPDSPILANKFILGRSLLVFRKWMINSYYNRLRSEEFDVIEGDLKKGRWRSYSNFFSEYGTFGGVFALTLALGKKISFQKTGFDTRLSEVDAANMRRNLTEILFLVAITSMALLLKALTAGDDDDESDLKYLCYFYINQLGRIERDIMFYVDPRQFKSVLKDPLPLMGVVTDASDLVTRSFTLVTGGEDDYQSGYRKDQSKTWVSVKKLVPGASNLDRLDSMTESILDK